MKNTPTRDKLERLGLHHQLSTKKRPSNTTLSLLENELLQANSNTDTALSIKERLERLVDATTSKSQKKQHPAPKKSTRTLSNALPGKQIETKLGSFYLAETIYPWNHQHGCIKLGRLRDISTKLLSVFSSQGDNIQIDINKTLFLDTETTGLAGGSGTCAFLVGLGFATTKGFIVQQMFMRDYKEESAMLAHLNELIRSFDFLVTYNGKSFDVPLLESRFVLSRQRSSFEELHHFDLLYSARGLWKARIKNCRLIELENQLLEFKRIDDVPGHVIPELYFRYIRTQNPNEIHHVFEHNRHDIVSLAALAIIAESSLDENYTPEHPIDDVSLGRWFERQSQPSRSMRHYQRAIESGLPACQKNKVLQRLAYQYKLRNDLEDAQVIWEQLAGENTIESLMALRELAMLLEHQEKNFPKALDKCELALKRLDGNPRFSYAFIDRWRASFEHRRNRLIRRIKTNTYTG